MITEGKIAEIRGHGIKALGQDALIRFLEGRRITYRERCLALCYDCMGYYADGKRDCQSPLCPLYPVMPYRGMKVDEAEAGSVLGARRGRS